MSLTAMAFVAAYVILLVLAFVRHPIFGLFGYLLAFYNHPPIRWWGAGLPDVRWALYAASFALIASFLRPPARSQAGGLSGTPAKLIVLYCAWMWAQLAWAVSPPSALEGAILFTKYVVLLVLIARTVDSVERLDQFVWAHVIGCFIFGWIAWRSPHMSHGRLEGIGGPGVDDSNTLGVHMITGLSFAGFKLLSTRSWIARGALVVMTAFIMNTVVLTGSRGALVGMAVAGVVAVVLAPPGMRKTIVSLAALGAVLLLILGHDQFWERMSTIRDYQSEESAHSRFEFIAPTLRMFRAHPLGVGHEGFRKLSPQYIPANLLSEDGTRSPHTTILAVLAEQGIVGIVLFGLLNIFVMRDLFRARRAVAAVSDEARILYPITAIGCSLAAFAICGLTGNYLKCEAQMWFIGLLTVIPGLVAVGEGVEEPAASELQLSDPPSVQADISALSAPSIR